MTKTLGDSREYKFLTANYRDRVYPDGVLIVDEVGEIEIRQWIGRGKKAQAPVVRFRPELPVNVVVEGAQLRVSELSIALESPSKASELAELLRRPVRAQEAERSLGEVEASLREFLVSREETLAFLARLKTDPREVLVSAESLWAADDNRDSLDAVYSTYSAKLGESLDKMTLSLGVAETTLGPIVYERLCALAYLVGATQDATLEGEAGRGQVLAALKELGISADAEDFEKDKLTDRFLQQAHPALVALVVEQALRGQRLEA